MRVYYTFRKVSFPERLVRWCHCFPFSFHVITNPIELTLGFLGFEIKISRKECKVSMVKHFWNLAPLGEDYIKYSLKLY